MGAVGLVFHAELRRRWRSWLAIAILRRVVAGPVLAAAAVWQTFANNRGAARVAVVPRLLIRGLVAAAIVANFITIAPAPAATPFKPADLLRTPRLSAS